MPEEDLYSGFDTNKHLSGSSKFARPQTKRLVGGSGASAQQNSALSSSYGREPSSIARPMTSKQSAGFSRAGGRPGTTSQSPAMFDPLNQGRTGRITPSSSSVLENGKTAEQSPEDRRREMEKRIYQLLDESYLAASVKNYQLSLEKAKEAAKKEQQFSSLPVLRPTPTDGNSVSGTSNGNGPNPDLTYCVLLNLAIQLSNNNLMQEALNAYAMIVKNKQFSQSNRLRVNMGNIYFQQQKYAQAIKMYQMALDQMPAVNKDLRCKILRNIGVANVKIGRFQDAVTSFESILEMGGDHASAFNLILCYFSLADKEKMRRTFKRMTMLKPKVIESIGNSVDLLSEDTDIFKEDELRSLARRYKKRIEYYVMFAARLIATVVEQSFDSGFDWVLDTIKSSLIPELMVDLELAKALQFLNLKDFKQAVGMFKDFLKKDQKVVATAATNLSFLFYLRGEYEEAAKYANQAIESDRYSSKALVNLANVHIAKSEWHRAKEILMDAVSIDALCIEALFNLGLTCKLAGEFDEALLHFEKLNTIVQDDPRVIFQIADIFDKMKNPKQALEWYSRLVPLVPTDPGVLAHIADLYQRNNDKAQALHYYSESYRYHPSSLEVLGWLGTYFVETEAYEKAIQYFEKAIFMQPYEVKWYFMEASCLRRSGNYQKAVDTYRKVHERFPENEDCLKYLIRICTDLGLPSAKEYSLKLAKLEAIKAERSGQKPVGEAVGGYIRENLQSNTRESAALQSNAGWDRVSSSNNLITPPSIGGAQVIPASTPILLAGNDTVDWNNENVEELLP